MFTMASARFATFSTQEIEKIVENKDSENTKKSTKLAREVFKEYLNEKSLSEPKEPPELAKCLTMQFLCRSEKERRLIFDSMGTLKTLRFALCRYYKARYHY